MCYLSPEGVVLGADSTTSAYITPGPSLAGMHYFNHAQKLFELGEDATVGVLTWGLGTLLVKSYRTLLAELVEDLSSTPAANLKEVTERWSQKFWSEYNQGWGLAIQRCKDLHAQLACGAPNPTGAAQRSAADEKEYEDLKRSLVVGFCLAGYWHPDRTPRAFELIFDPLGSQPAAQEKPLNHYVWWGAPNLIKRLILGADDELRASIIGSPHWKGTRADLDALLAPHQFGHSVLPIRDAIDFVHACIYSTIKALKFSNLFQICGGAIELAVITSDRRFRWVRHKSLGSAITES